MTDLSNLQLVHALAETAYMKAVSEAPPVRERSCFEQQYLDRLCDALLRASKEYRDAKNAEFWDRHERGAEETRRMFPWLKERNDVL